MLKKNHSTSRDLDGSMAERSCYAYAVISFLSRAIFDKAVGLNIRLFSFYLDLRFRFSKYIFQPGII